MIPSPDNPAQAVFALLIFALAIVGAAASAKKLRRWVRIVRGDVRVFRNEVNGNPAQIEVEDPPAHLVRSLHERGWRPVDWRNL